MDWSKRRRTGQARPALEGLEDRKLLSSNHIGASSGAGAGRSSALIADLSGTSLGAKKITYTTRQGTHVLVQLFGLGSLAGSSVDPDGALNLVFSGTNESSQIIGRLHGGNGHAPLRSIHHALIPIDNLSGIGSSVLYGVNFRDFDLVTNGQINLTDGVHTLLLNSVAPNTQINLRELPASLLNQTTTSSNSSTLTPGFILDLTGARTLTTLQGELVPGFNLLAPGLVGQSPGVTAPGAPPAPAGAVIAINHVNGQPRFHAALGDPEVFGSDPTAGALIRFDAATGAVLQTIPLPSPIIAGVALGRNDGHLVALVGNGSTIFAFNAISGAPEGQFSTANLPGFSTVDGLGSTDTRTVIANSQAGNGGMLQIIDVAASLASPTGQAVPLGKPFTPQREFFLSGGLTGVAASNNILAAGSAFFDTFQPNRTQFGFLTVNTTANRLSESSRTALQLNGSTINTGSGTLPTNPALGSVDQSLALDVGVSNGANVIQLLSPVQLSNRGTVNFADPNLLSGLSESFRPDLVGSAVVDVQGNIQSFRAQDARGLVLNDNGNLNLVKIDRASDSTIIGLPIGHVEIAHRTNVPIISSTRDVDGRNNVTVVPNLLPAGPLSIPSRS